MYILNGLGYFYYIIQITIWLTDHLNTRLLVACYSNGSIIRMTYVWILTVKQTDEICFL